MSDVYNLKDFAFAKQMVEEIPKAVEALETARTLLIDHRNFNSISIAINDIDTAILNLETRISYFQNVLSNKGEQP